MEPWQTGTGLICNLFLSIVSDNQNVVLLRVELSEGKTEERLKQLVLDLEKTKNAQLLLNNSRKLGNVDADTYAAKTVELTNRLTLQRAEQSRLTKDLQLFRDANEGVGTSYKNLQASLSLAQRQFQQLDGSADNSTEATQALSKTIEGLRTTLRATDETQKNFARGIGDYPKNGSEGLEKLVQQLVSLQEEQKRYVMGSEQEIQVRQRIGFFQQAAAQAGAKENRSYEETTNFIKQYGEAIRPATADLIKLTEQQEQLAASGGEVTEEVRKIGFQISALGKQIKDTPAELPEIKVPTGSLEELAQGLVKIREQQKGVATDSAAFKQAEREIKAYEAAAVTAGAEVGLSYDQAKKRLDQYTAQVQPLVAALVKLEAEQAEVAKGSEAYTKLQTRITTATQALDKAAKPTKGLSGGLLEAARNSDTLGGAVGKATEYQEKFSQAQALAKIAIGGNVTALGALRLALIASGLGLAVVVLGSLVAFLTKTAAGTAILNRVMGQFGAVVKLVTNLAADFGEKLVKAADNPKQAFSDLVDFIGTNLMNRVKAFGVLVDGIKSGNISKIADSFIQAGTGITEGTAKIKSFGAEVSAAADAGARLSAMQRQLERDTNDNIDTNKRLLNEVERLRNVRDNEFNTLAVRQKANENAYKVEMQREQALVKVAREKIAVAQLALDQAGGRGRSEELFKELQDARNELKGVQEDAAGKQNELITNRFQLTKDGLDKEKEATAKSLDARIALRKDALALEAQLLDRQLKQVQVNSDQELSLLQQKLRNGYEAELNVKALMASAKKVIDAKYESESSKLLLDSLKARAQASYEAEAANINRDLLLVKSGTDQETELRREAIRNQLAADLAKLDRLKDNAQQEALLRATADKALNDVNYSAALTKLDRFLQGSRNALEQSHAAGKLSEEKYNDAVIISDQLAAGSRLQLAREFKQETVQLEQQATAAKIAGIKKVGDAQRAEQAERVAQAQALAEGLTSLFAETVSTTGATLESFFAKSLILLIDSIEKEIIGAQIKILVKSFTESDSIATFGATGALRAAAIIGLVTAATETLKAKLQPTPQQFAQGGIAYGPSHENGGIPLYYRGRPAGIEIEGMEPVLTANVTRNPLLLSLASTVNQLAGGRALAPNLPRPYMALGGVAQPLVLSQLKGSAGEGINYTRLAQELGKVNIYTKTQETRTSLDKLKYTQQLGSD